MRSISIKIVPIQSYSSDFPQHVEAERLKHHPQQHDRLK